MKRPIHFSLFAAGFWLSATTPPLSAAQDGKSDPLPPALATPEVLETRIAEVEAASGLEEQAKTKLLELYRKTLRNLQTAAAGALRVCPRIGVIL